jgi:hypothetical protein
MLIQILVIYLNVAAFSLYTMYKDAKMDEGLYLSITERHVMPAYRAMATRGLN